MTGHHPPFLDLVAAVAGVDIAKSGLDEVTQGVFILWVNYNKIWASGNTGEEVEMSLHPRRIHRVYHYHRKAYSSALYSFFGRTHKQLIWQASLFRLWSLFLRCQAIDVPASSRAHHIE
jgi:hypothetical protein